MIPPRVTNVTATESPSERILDAAEALIRRHGPAKVTVMDVARALGMSHSNVYRHFASKAALREAVVERWLRAIEAELLEAPAEGGAAERLRAWLRAFAAAKRARQRRDPELFAAYALLGDEQQGAVVRHHQALVAQLVAILTAGINAGDFAPQAPNVAARAVLDATSAFHDPHCVPNAAADPNGPARLEAVIELLVVGLKAREAH